MRLNERELAYFAQNCRRVDKQGYLSKRGLYNTSFKRRWFALRGNLLFYYRSQESKDNEPHGVIVLAGCRVDTCDRHDERDPHTFKLKFEFADHDTREYELAASNEIEMMSWMKAITEADYEILRVAVDDLRHRVEVEERKQAAAAASGVSGNEPTETLRLLHLTDEEADAPSMPQPYQPADAATESAASARESQPATRADAGAREASSAASMPSVVSASSPPPATAVASAASALAPAQAGAAVSVSAARTAEDAVPVPPVRWSRSRSTSNATPAEPAAAAETMWASFGKSPELPAGIPMPPSEAPPVAPPRKQTTTGRIATAQASHA